MEKTKENREKRKKKVKIKTEKRKRKVKEILNFSKKLIYIYIYSILTFNRIKEERKERKIRYERKKYEA